MDNEFVYGKNSVEALLKNSNRSVNKLFILSSINKDSKIHNILKLAKEKRIPVTEISKSKLDKMIDNNVNHQGVIAGVSPVEYASLDDLIEQIKQKNTKGLIIILDNIEDPQNLGSIIRSSEVLGADGIIIPKRRSAQATSAVAKASSGAIEFLPIVQVNNLSMTIEQLKQEGYWIIGAEYESNSKFLYEIDFNMHCVIVMGAEDKGISLLIKKNCDIIAKIPQFGKTNSLNVSSALSIILYEIVRQRNKLI